MAEVRSLSDVKVILSRFDTTKARVHEAVSDGVMAIALAIEQRAKYNITEVGAVDTGALRASIYAEGPGSSGRREAAIAEAEAEAATEGQHSGRPHPFTVADEETIISGDLRAKVGVAAEYGIYIEFGTVHASERPYLTPAVDEVGTLAEDMVAKMVREALAGL